MPAASSQLYCEARSEKRISSVARGSRAGHAGPGGPIQAQHTGDELADSDSQVAPKPSLQAGVILCAAEEVAHQLSEHWAAAHKLHHSRCYRAAQERSTIEATHDARRELQFGAESSLHPGRIFLRASCGERAPQQFAGPNGIEKSLASERIDPGRRVSYECPVFSDHTSFGKRALSRRRQHMAVKLCALRRYVVLLDKVL